MSAAVSWSPGRDVAVPAVAAGCVIGAAAVLGPLVVLEPRLAMLAVVGGLLGALVWRVPAAAAFLTITITPLVAGIDRGRVIPVLLDRPGRRPGQLQGRSPWMQSVHLQAPAHLLGTIQPVRIIDAKQLSLTGTADLVAPDLVAPHLVSEEAA